MTYDRSCASTILSKIVARHGNKAHMRPTVFHINSLTSFFFYECETDSVDMTISQLAVSQSERGIF